MTHAATLNSDRHPNLTLSGGAPSTIIAAFAPVSGLVEAQNYTRWLTHHHYENFSVVSTLLPRHLRQDFCNVYAFCRISDDLGDEVEDTATALRYLEDFKTQTQDCYAGKARTAVFIALTETIAKYQIPIQPFLDLIDAFEQDQRITRYETHEQLVDYCRRSADPVGRLVLYMCGYRDAERQRLSDKTCTALQLANFWQDVRRDLLDKNRIYLPRETMNRFDVTEQQLRDLRFDGNYRNAIRFEVERTEAMFIEGEKLIPLLNREHRAQISLFGKGGRAILNAIRARDFDTITSRPKLSKLCKARLIASTLAQYTVGSIIPGGQP